MCFSQSEKREETTSSSRDELLKIVENFYDELQQQTRSRCTSKRVTNQRSEDMPKIQEKKRNNFF